ncbi:MAG TPA: amidophosphoribosyltransferase [Thermoanaerobaculia bacterium]|jgi:amidophosphoribosyltransferase
MLDDKLHEECGVFGVLGRADAANLVYLGLYALQHRGQESAGIAAVTADGRIVSEKEMGYVADVFTAERIARLPGDTAIGHVRYSTAGGSMLCNAQPIVAFTSKGSIAVAHNGNLVNGDELRKKLEAEGAIFNSTADSELFVHLIARSKASDLEGAFIDALSQVQGAYAVALLAPGRIFAARDPYGFRPLVLGKLEDSYAISSETCAFDLIAAETVREIGAGEIIVIERETGVRVVRQARAEREARCIFEHVYFARPDSVVFGNSVADVRQRFGAQLAREHAINADIVVPVPDSGVFAALGYAQEAKIPFQYGLVRNHYVGRTFIEPKQTIRSFGVKVKLNPVRGLVEGKRIVLIDDSIVRGTTSKKIVRMLKDAGATEVHMRISSPPTSWPCYYGIDTPERQGLIASSKSLEEIRDFIEADSLGYLSEDGLLEAVRRDDDPRALYCTACFSGKYLHETAAAAPAEDLVTAAV